MIQKDKISIFLLPAGYGGKGDSSQTFQESAFSERKKFYVIMRKRRPYSKALIILWKE